MGDKLYPLAKLELFLEKLSELQRNFDVVVVPYYSDELGVLLGLEEDEHPYTELGCFEYDHLTKRFKLMIREVE